MTFATKLLETAAGCEIALRELGEQRSLVTTAGQQRSGSEQPAIEPHAGAGGFKQRRKS